MEQLRAVAAAPVPRVVVVLPAYNESASIEGVLRQAHEALDAAGFSNHEFIVVNDGSRDDTAARARSLTGELEITVIEHAGNQGLGRAVRTGLVAAAARVGPHDVVLTTESDGTQPVDVLPKLVRAVLDGDDFVVGSPLASAEGFRGVPFHRRLLSRGANLIYANLFPIHTLEDYTVLVRGIRGEVLRRAVEAYGTHGLIVRRGFEGVHELVLKLRPLLPRVREIPITIDHTRLRRKSQMPIARTIRAALILVAIELLARAQRRMGDL